MNDGSFASSARQTTVPPNLLSGYRVLDLSQIIAGPTTTRTMAALGAEVIKVELAPDGDPSRRLPGIRDGRSAYYVQQNLGKKGLCIDASKAAGKALLQDLAAHCDVLVENFAPGVIARLGLGWDVVRRLNPRLIMCSISAFGQSGPMSHLPGYDYIAQAYSGITDLTGEESGSPYFPQVALGDAATGMYAFGAVVTALLHRERGGSGQLLDISLFDTYVSAHELGVQVPSVGATSILPRRARRQHFAVAPLGIFRGARGYLVIVGLGKQWEQLCRAMGRPELAADPRFSDNTARLARVDEVVSLIEGWLAEIGDDDRAIRLLEAERVPVAPVITPSEMARLPHARQRGTVRTVCDRVLGRFDVPGMPLRFSAAPDAAALEAPFLGEHNAEVLSGLLGYDATRIRTLETEGVLHHGRT